ncbi:MAG TPA: tripartite tricarboxylate transporter substrate binding protein [Burkholderiaceae bacterium]|jgi:tripartite-type tricarboxylate transporter receptor subunit TctC
MPRRPSALPLPTPSRRQLLLTSLAAPIGLLLADRARAQGAAPLRMIVPFPAGGTADVLPRIVADRLREAYPGGVIVDNRPGAGGNIGADVVFRAKPDGLTLLVSPPGPIAINQSLYPKLSFDPSKWVPVTVLATVPNVMVVSPNVKAKDLLEFIAQLKAKPGGTTYASQGNGSTSHLTANLFMSLTGTQMVHVPYKGTAPALVDVMGGQVDVFFDNLSSSLPHARAGRLRILAVADSHRSPVLKEVPTFGELGLPAMNAVTWFAVMAPPGTPDAVARRTQQAMAEVLKRDDVQTPFADQGAEAKGWSSEETGRFVQAEIEKWRRVIKAANVTID